VCSLKSWWPGVSKRLKASPSCSKLITAEDTEMPRSRSIAIQSERTRRRSPRAFTSPASWIAPPNSSNFSVKVVLPASGCEMIAKVRRRIISSLRLLINSFQLFPGVVPRPASAPPRLHERWI